jgi:hypothetical protein
MKLLLSFIQALLFVALTFGLQNIATGAITFNGTNQQLTIPSGTVSNTLPKTFSVWYYPTSNKLAGLMYFRDASSQNVLILQTTSAGKAEYAIRGASGGYAIPQSSNTQTLNVWNHMAGKSASLTSHAVWLNGTKATSSATAVALGATLTSQAIGSIGGSGYFPGRIAEVAAWNADLTDDEIASLAKGFSPDRIRPQSLVIYAPLNREVIEIKGGVTITNSAGAAADHPRTYQ